MTASASFDGDPSAQLQQAMGAIQSYQMMLGSTMGALDALFADLGPAAVASNGSPELGGQALSALQTLTIDAAGLQGSTQQFSAAVELLQTQVGQLQAQLQSGGAAWDQGYAGLRSGIDALSHAGAQAGTASNTALTGVQDKLQAAQVATQGQVQQYDAASQELHANLTSTVQPAVSDVTQTFQATVSAQTAQSTQQVATTYTQLDPMLDSVMQTGAEANQTFQNAVTDGSQTVASAISSGVNDPVAQAAQDLTGGTLDDLAQSVTASVSAVQDGSDVAATLGDTAAQTQDLKSSAGDITQAITAAQSGDS